MIDKMLILVELTEKSIADTKWLIKLTKDEYEQIENYLYRLDLENGYIQELGEHEEEYVPKWDYK